MNYLTFDELERCGEMRAMCACQQLRRANRGVTELYEAAMAPSGLNVTQLPVLVALGLGGDLSVSTLADVLALDRTTLTRNLNVLAERGLVRTYEHPQDARIRMASLTLEGSRVLAVALAGWEEVQRVVEERFGRTRLRALYEELAALGDALA